MSYEDIVEAQTNRDVKAAGGFFKRSKSAPIASQETRFTFSRSEKAEEEIRTLELANYCSILRFD